MLLQTLEAVFYLLSVVCGQDLGYKGQGPDITRGGVGAAYSFDVAVVEVVGVVDGEDVFTGVFVDGVSEVGELEVGE